MKEMMLWLETTEALRKIDIYMSKHPIFSPLLHSDHSPEKMTSPRREMSPHAAEFVPSFKSIVVKAQNAPVKIHTDNINSVSPRGVQIQTVFRNDGREHNPAMIAWITGPDIAGWCMSANIGIDADDADEIQNMCFRIINKTTGMSAFVDAQERGEAIVAHLLPEHRREIEKSYEEHYAEALSAYKSVRSHVKDKTTMTPGIVEEIMKKYLSGRDYYNEIKSAITSYAVYRHSEFRFDFSVGVHRVAFVIFPYVLPGEDCAYHKASIIVKNDKFSSGMYQTCRWRIE
jgi:hypothetical protein